jgi:Glycosyl hydrolases family 18
MTQPGGAAFKSPVYFMPLDAQPQNITEAIQATGNKSFWLAFVLDSGGCTPAWNGQAAHAVASDTAVAAVVNAARAAGADVGVSFGGYNGTELGQSCGSAGQLAAAYQAVIDKYKLTHIDLDIENTALGDVANETKRFQAIKMLEDAATAAGRTLVVSVTLPVTVIGLPDTGKEELRAAIQVGARIDIINIMDFDYGGPAATQAEADIAIAEQVHAQLKALWPAWSDADAYAHLGLQLMNGHTDQPSELFTVDTFKALLAYAQQKHLGWFANWALNRDRSCDPSVPHNWAEGFCSSVSQQPYEFTKIVAQYGG